jgi:hypothetical protein
MLAFPKTAILLLLPLALGLGACSDDGRDVEAGGGDADTDGDTDTWDDWDGPTGSISGTVLAPNQAFPVAGALVYLSLDVPAEIEPTVHCEDCQDMTATFWTLSAPDGTFTIDGVPVLDDWHLVVQKGLFRRISEIEVLLNEWDRSHDLLAKLGLGEVGGDGRLVYGTETFHIFNDAVSYGSYPHSSTLFASQETLEGYHQTFFPCTSDSNPINFVQEHAAMLRDYVNAGGKVYNSCCTALWTDYAFPEYIDFYGGDGPNDPTDVRDVGRISSTAYSTHGEVIDQELRDWLSNVTSENPDSFPFTDGYVKIDNLVDVDDGMGIEEDDYWVKPYAWVVDNDAYAGAPLMVTYNYGCGKVFFSVYETSHSALAAITPQEYVLLHLILEVGVCSGSYPVE